MVSGKATYSVLVVLPREISEFRSVDGESVQGDERGSLPYLRPVTLCMQISTVDFRLKVV